MDWPLQIQGRFVHESDVSEIRALLASRSNWSRRQFSIALCERWAWQRPDGQLKDMACREYLRKLEALGLICLPTPRARGAHAAQVVKVDVDRTPVICKLNALAGLELVDARTDRADEQLFNSLLKEHHYLSFNRTVGRNMKYLVRSADGRPLACLLFGSAAWKAKDRDAYLGWDAAARERNVNLITNNTRFLILPWVEVANLASWSLSHALRRLRRDWLNRYGEEVFVVETFVDRERYLGTCYKAANWQCVGSTVGRSRQDRSHKLSVPVKDVYVYPLAKRFRERLCEG